MSMEPSPQTTQPGALAPQFKLPMDDILARFQARLSAKAEESLPSPTPPITDAAIRAALCDSYAASEIGVSDTEGELLHQSDVVMVGGRRRLRLADRARQAILREARGTPRFAELLDELSGSDAEPRTEASGSLLDAPSMWIRRFLVDAKTELTSTTPTDLRAAVAARERLGDLQLGPEVPTVDEARQLLEYAELLEPLRISIGALGAWTDVPASDRFVGRGKELRTLRSFVDEIASESALESVQRGAAKLGSSLKRQFGGDGRVPGTRLIVARGGLGKSALIAKFVLDHALRQSRRFPFAYLDFDSAALQPREPRLLLLEVTRQVALQFPEVRDDLRALGSRIRDAVTGEGVFQTDLADPFEEFRALLRERVTLGERALLIVLDTVEIVQSDSIGMYGLLAFVERLSQNQFSELRVVAAGRAPVPELVAKTSARQDGATLTLEPLSIEEARDMAERFGRSLLGQEWNSAWTPRVAGKSTHSAERREPLSVRVAVEALRDESDPAERERLSLRIEEMGENASESFVGKLYQRRVLEHVKDRQARKIAWPGLILRRVTVEIIRDFLAAQCELDPAQAATVFDALSKEVWIVSRRGEVLQHHPDLRSRTLPLMRRFDEAKFLSINSAAISYFHAGKDSDPQSRAEWIYHRLLGGESVDRVDADWSEEVAALLVDASDDFPTGSLAADYLAARTASRLLPDVALLRLPPRLALLHIARTAPQKAVMSERAIDPVLAQLPLADIPVDSLSGTGRAARACLLVKTGRWNVNDEPIAGADGPWQPLAATAIAFRRARTASDDRASRLADELMRFYAPRGAIDRAPLGALVQDLATCRRLELMRFGNLPITRDIDEALSQRLVRPRYVTDATIGVSELRTAMLFGHDATIPATRLWVSQLTERSRASEPLAWSVGEIVALGFVEEQTTAVASALDEQGLSWESFLLRSKGPDSHIRLQSPALDVAMRDAIRSHCERTDGDAQRRLRLFAAARDEDWVVPIAYAAFRDTEGKASGAIVKRFESYLPTSGGFIRHVLSRTVVPTDLMEMLRQADEAGDLVGVADLLCSDVRQSGATDLRELTSRLQEWRRAIQSLMDGEMESLAR